MRENSSISCCILPNAGGDAEARSWAFEDWRTPILPGDVIERLRTPAQFEAAARFVQPEVMNRYVRISADVEQRIARIRDHLEPGFLHVCLHIVGRNQRQFIEEFGERVLPRFALKQTSAA